jgi:hypothetical protein
MEDGWFRGRKGGEVVRRETLGKEDFGRGVIGGWPQQRFQGSSRRP